MCVCVYVRRDESKRSPGAMTSPSEGDMIAVMVAFVGNERLCMFALSVFVCLCQCVSVHLHCILIVQNQPLQCNRFYLLKYFCLPLLSMVDVQREKRGREADEG